jgi:hypothetical protein
MSDPEDLRAVQALLERRRDELIARYDAAGVGIGREGGDYVIVVYLKSEKHRPREEVALEGVQLKFMVTGPFTIRR